MAELLIRVVDKINPNDAAQNQLCFKAGDVIHVAPDGWPWGTEEVGNPDWRIVKLPGLDPALLNEFLVRQTVVVDNKPHMTRKRAVCIDTTNALVQQYIASGQIITIDLSANQQAFIERKLTKPIAPVVD